MTELIKKLCLLNGTSGRENEVRDFIINEIKNFADSIEIDPLGNLLVMKAKREPKTALCWTLTWTKSDL